MKTGNYASKKVLVLGCVHILLGLYSICLGIPSASPSQNSFPYGNLGYGIWCGVMYCISGVVGIMAGLHPTPNLIVWQMVLSLVSVGLAALQVSLGIAAAGQDFAIMKLRQWETAAGVTGAPESDIQYYNDLKEFFTAYFPMTAMLARSNNRITAWVSSGVVAVDTLLAIGGFFMLIFGTLAAASGCKVTCCNSLHEEDEENRIPVVQQSIPHQQQIYHEGKVSSSPISNTTFQADQ